MKRVDREFEEYRKKQASYLMQVFNDIYLINKNKNQYPAYLIKYCNVIMNDIREVLVKVNNASERRQIEETMRMFLYVVNTNYKKILKKFQKANHLRKIDVNLNVLPSELWQNLKNYQLQSQESDFEKDFDAIFADLFSGNDTSIEPGTEPNDKRDTQDELEVKGSVLEEDNIANSIFSDGNQDEEIIIDREGEEMIPLAQNNQTVCLPVLEESGNDGSNIKIIEEILETDGERSHNNLNEGRMVRIIISDSEEQTPVSPIPAPSVVLLQKAYVNHSRRRRFPR